MNTQLGMPVGTATNRLRKMVMFQLVQRCSLDFCIRCKEKITKAQDLTIDHVLPWRGEDTSRFWSLENIKFSHHSCNSRAARRKHTTPEQKRKRKAEWMKTNYSTKKRREKKTSTGW